MTKHDENHGKDEGQASLDLSFFLRRRNSYDHPAIGPLQTPINAATLEANLSVSLAKHGVSAMGCDWGRKDAYLVKQVNVSKQTAIA